MANSVEDIVIIDSILKASLCIIDDVYVGYNQNILYHIFYWNNAEFTCVIKAYFAACYLPPGQ